MNSMITKTYDPSKINITFLGVIITDFADGDFVSVTFPERFTPVEGADGSENRINTGKKGCDVTITIQRASSTNDLLSALHITDAATNTGKGSLSIKDLNGTSLLFSAQAYIKKFADSADGNSMGTRAWEIRAPFATVNIGGNL